MIDEKCYDRGGKPIPDEVRKALREHENYWQLGKTTIVDQASGDWAMVTTVWVGINLDPIAEPPLIFETLVESPNGGDGDRYASCADAKKGHLGHVATAAATMADPVVIADGNVS